jgi:subtilisin family serine protease
MGVTVMYSSKWFNAATIVVDDESIISKIKSTSFIASIEKTRNASQVKSNTLYSKNENERATNETRYDTVLYGKSYTQIKLLNGQYLHAKGFSGNDILIAVIDAGFKQADKYIGLTDVWKEGRIRETRNFVNSGNTILNDQAHGAEVLSTIAASYTDSLVGTAPQASFMLLVSEDAQSESPVECDNWIAAAELADSAGADIISTSLGYNNFDDSLFNFVYGSKEEQTARISLAAEKASSKGMVVLASAGNDGAKTYHYIGTPANATNILAVGACNGKGIKADFSSFGPSSDGRIKPDVMAMGQSVIAETSPGVYSAISGTSLSCPLVAGLTACLMQAYPNAPSKTIRQSILESANQYSKPDSAMGYGIPDFQKAFESLGRASTLYNSKAYAYPNPFSSNVTLVNELGNENHIVVECFDLTGEKIFSVSAFGGYTILQNEIAGLKQGVYLFRCIGEKGIDSIVGIKTNKE